MTTRRSTRRAIGYAAGGLGLAAAAYAGYVGAAWFRYGRPASPNYEAADPWLDRFMPEYEVAERHSVQVDAPAEIALLAATEADLRQTRMVRGIFRARELILGAEPERARRPTGLLADMEALGWRVLAENPGREIVVGAVTQPWMADAVFRGLPPDEFRDFLEPGYVKIVWTLRADPLDSSSAMFRTETRVATTDATARSKFRWYWARFSPGIVLIRRVLLRQVKQDAERRARSSGSDRRAGSLPATAPRP